MLSLFSWTSLLVLMTPYGNTLQKHIIEPHRSSPSKFRWSNTDLLPVSIHCNAQGGQEAMWSGSWEIPVSKVPLSPSFWCVLLPSGSRASDQLIFAKSSDLSRLPWCHCPRRQMHPLHLYVFPDHGSNYLQVQNKRSRRQLHFAAAENKKIPSHYSASWEGGINNFLSPGELLLPLQISLLFTTGPKLFPAAERRYPTAPTASCTFPS